MSNHHHVYMEVVRLMEQEASSPYNAPPHHHASSRPTIGFPLGTALLLIVVFSISGIFSCCYHWDKLRHLRGDFSGQDLEDDSLSKPKLVYSENKREEEQSFPVIMAGDQFARFIAMPCPCEPPRKEKIAIEEIQTPHKPQHLVIEMS